MKQLGIAAAGFALAVILFGAGAFALYVFPGRSETVGQVAAQPTPVLERCERFWQLIMGAQTDEAVIALRTRHPDQDCFRSGTTGGATGLTLPGDLSDYLTPPLDMGNLPPLILPTRVP